MKIIKDMSIIKNKGEGYFRLKYVQGKIRVTSSGFVDKEGLCDYIMGDEHFKLQVTALNYRKTKPSRPIIRIS